LRVAAAAAKRLRQMQIAEAFDPAFPESRPTPEQWEFFRDIGIRYRWIVAANRTGKTASPAREIAWICNGNHPFWTRPEAWGDEPLTILISAQSKKLAEEEIWTKKLQPFFDMSLWKERRVGGLLDSVENTKTGDTIIFVSHADGSEKNRRFLQGFTCHISWCDEMPGSVGVLEELMRRVDGREGYFVASFTPKVANGAIRRIVDAAPVEKVEGQLSRRYKWSRFSNPLFKGKEAEAYASLEGLSEAMKRCILFGDWAPGDNLVFWYEPGAQGTPIPATYSLSWRHMAVVDPATESKLGLLIFAEVPLDSTDATAPPPGSWLITRAEYVEGIFTPHKIVDDVERRIAPYNIVERIADPAATWFIRQAEDMPDGRKFLYRGVPHKNDEGMKEQMIADVQDALGTRVWIVESQTTALLVDEIGTCSRSEDTGQIRKRSRFHLLDCLQYGVQMLPTPVLVKTYSSYEDRLRAYDDWRRERAAEEKQSNPHGLRRYRVRGATGGSSDAPLPPLSRSSEIRIPARVLRRRRY
jgi:hypothetical protein